MVLGVDELMAGLVWLFLRGHGGMAVIRIGVVVLRVLMMLE